LDVKVTDYNPGGITILGGTTNAGTMIVYQESGTFTLGGSAGAGAWNNPPTVPSNQPKNFVYFGMPGVTSVTIGGSAVFLGVIYAPEADISFNGGGSSDDLMGSFIGKSLTIKGHYQVHFDVSLLGYYYGYYAIGTWAEL
jgi:hypothetical protein